jgi:hypothetical protein
MTSKKEREQIEIQRLMDYFRKWSDEQFIKLINFRLSNIIDSANKKAFKAVLKERGIDKNAF